MNSPQQRKPSLVPEILILVISVTFFLIPTLLSAEFRDQWQSIIIIQVLLTVAMVVYLVWFMRKKRDDYWRGRGKDTGHHEL
ncbi:hypothetical protein [Arthrobacter glacialis]|uniref:Uncharacterized protein n=1 Tax=Arthrobacter glacialis TaxID=1664 RepID=A0A2S3ZWD1_ARTGL|nr:hypothetical protein [Arthrobacter glacialis]POH73586.1 hypothetical protein CVS27_09415 [Arthrobacter glacialis]